MDVSLQFGIVGLGRVGARLAAQALGKGMYVAGYDPAGFGEELLSAGIDCLDKPSQFHARLQAPRLIMLYLPAGKAVDQLLAQLTPVLDVGDVVMDGSHSHWGDSLRRHRHCRDHHGIDLVDCGTSEGGQGFQGACFTVGGSEAGYARVEPVLQRLAAPGGLLYCGPPGCGHYARHVQSGIQAGMLAVLTEGLQLLESFQEDLPVAEVLRCWNRGGAIPSAWLERLADAYVQSEEAAPVEIDRAQLSWLVEHALERQLPVPVIAQSLMQALRKGEGTPAPNSRPQGSSPGKGQKMTATARLPPWAQPQEPASRSDKLESH